MISASLITTLTLEQERSQPFCMQTASSPRADESADSRDPVIQQTPVAGQSFPRGYEPKSQTSFGDPERRESVESGGIGDTQAAEDANPHTPSPSDRDPEGPVSWELQTIGNDSAHDNGDGNELRYNKRTPNLDRIAKFFKNNRTPGDENVLMKYNLSEDGDTPVSRRDDDSPTSREPRGSALEFNSSAKELGRSKPITFSAVKSGDSRDNGTGGTSGVNCSPKDVNKSLANEEQTSEDSDERSSSIKVGRLRRHKHQYRVVLSDEDSSQMACVDETDTSQKRVDLKTVVENSGVGENSIVLQEGRSLDYSRIDDTTNGIPEMWVLRPSNSGGFNSNKSTQVINTTETQISPKEAIDRKEERGDDLLHNEAVEIPTQVIASQSEAPLGRKGVGIINQEIGFSTQIIQSPEDLLSNSLETPRAFPRINFEPIMEVPETSSPSKSREIYPEGNSSPSPAGRERKKGDYATQVDASDERVRLQISSKPESISNEDEQCELDAPSTKVDDTVVVLSDAELTQELPEIDEDAVQANSGIFEEVSQEDKEKSDQSGIVRKRHGAETVELIAEKEHRSSKPSPTKRIRRGSRLDRDVQKDNLENNDREVSAGKLQSPQQNGNDKGNEDQVRQDLPNEIRYSDEEYLSKNDIKFEDAVWCQYSLDYRYYPGRILGYEEQSNSYWVCFETGESLTKSEDIYYLDIRVGDSVTYAGKQYQVVGLESKDAKEGSIRCIRGYDTVHLKRRKKSGSLVQKTIIRPLASASLDLTEWTKRPKIILDGGFHTKAKAYQALQHPIRGRKSNATSSPRKVKSTSHREQTARPVYKEESDEETNLAEGKDTVGLHDSLDLVPRCLQTSDQGNNECFKVFENCLFVLTGLNEDRQQLHEVIESQGGEILQLGFSELFEYERIQESQPECVLYALQLEWIKSVQENNYKFACLITRRHLRSLKYLETLALGWPTLHWKFIRACLQKGRLCLDSIHQYLLPSGESYRLSFEPSTKTGIIKSNNIYQFYSNLSQGLMLESQVHGMREQMKDYIVILHGQSELDRFIRFALACLGVAELYHIRGQANATAQDEIHQINQKLDELLKKNDALKVVIYVNKSSGISSALLDDMRDQISVKSQSTTAERFKFHVEAKEWLIQSIINGAAGFDE